MKKTMLLAGLVALVLSLALVTGCGGDKAQAQMCAGCGVTIADGHAKMIDGKAYCEHCQENMASEAAKEGGDQQVAVHDCDGGCGMKDVPIKNLTEVNGKFYCQSCLDRISQRKDDGHSN